MQYQYGKLLKHIKKSSYISVCLLVFVLVCFALFSEKKNKSRNELSPNSHLSTCPLYSSLPKTVQKHCYVFNEVILLLCLTTISHFS